jgi:hypothetical protein
MTISIGCVKVSGRLYQWSLVRSTSQIQKSGHSSDFLRISAIEEDFDIAIRIDSTSHFGRIINYLGPVLVISGNFPNRKEPIPIGRLIALRSKLCRLKDGSPNSTTVERVIQWIGSKHFRYVRVNANGGTWVGDEAKYDKYDSDITILFDS